MSIIFETPRLALREMSLADVSFVAEMLGDPEVMRFYAPCDSRDQSEAWVLRQLDRYASFGYGLWLVVEKARWQPVGQVGLLPARVEGIDDPDIAYMIHRDYWRRGIGFEAAEGVRDYAFDVLDVPRVVSFIRPENAPSRGLAEKLGMQCQPSTVQHAGYEHLLYAAEQPGPPQEGRS